MSSNVVWFADIGLADLETVGGKNSSLGEMVSELSALAGASIAQELLAAHASRFPERG